MIDAHKHLNPFKERIRTNFSKSKSHHFRSAFSDVPPPYTIDKMSQSMEASTVFIKQHIALLAKSLDRDRLMDGLKNASLFLGELRTNVLTPKQYYELYVLAFDGLEVLSNYLKQSHPKNHLADLYELVQYAGNIIPRLYLMITVGTSFMATPDAPVEEVMKDMLEMCRGLQHPIRGLFLRYFLSQKCKNLFPVATEQEQENSIQFIITNFVEMNKLWVRLQHQGHSSERLKRTKEREELKILVGSNLVRLSQMENIKEDYYKTSILPVLMEQIVQCRDVLAQEYLLDVIIQVFPDEFHLQTLDQFGDVILQFNQNVDISKIVNELATRLLGYKEREKEQQLKVEVNLFQKFWDFLEKLRKSSWQLSPVVLSSILINISKLSITFYPDALENVNQIFILALEEFNRSTNELEEKDAQLEENWKLLLLTPLQEYTDLNQVLQEPFKQFLIAQPLPTQREIAVAIMETMIRTRLQISDPEMVDKIFDALQVVVSPTAKSATHNALFGEEKPEREQELLGCFLHQLYSKDPKVHFKVLQTAANHLAGHNVKSTYPTLIYQTWLILRKAYLLMDYAPLEKEVLVEMFKFLIRLIKSLCDLQEKDFFHNCIVYFLESAKMSDQLELNSITYDFIIESLVIYEESIVDSKSQYPVLVSIMGTLLQLPRLILNDDEGFQNLTVKTTLYCSKLLKKTDQCRGVYLASHLWWVTKDCNDVDLDKLSHLLKDANLEEVASPKSDSEEEEVSQVTIKKTPKRVLECLQKALRVADSVTDSVVSSELFVEILNTSLYFFIHGNELITTNYLNGLLELIRGGINKQQGDNEARRHFQRVQEYILLQKEVDDRFEDILV